MKYNIIVSLIKAYLKYFDISLLGYKVNSLGLISSKEKLKAISSLKSLSTLNELEYYLELIEYL